jgi:hypothetical protein
VDVLVFLVLAALAFVIWRIIRRAYLRAQMRHLIQQGDPVIMGLHEHQMSRDWYSLAPEMRVAMAVDFQQDPSRVYAAFRSGGSDLPRSDFDRIMRSLIREDPACSRLTWGNDSG